MEELHYQVMTGLGELIRVHLSGNAANVLVMDDVDYENYKKGNAYHYYGGYYTRSPVLIKPAVYGKLHVVINLGGFAGSVNAIVQVVHPAKRTRR